MHACMGALLGMRAVHACTRAADASQFSDAKALSAKAGATYGNMAKPMWRWPVVPAGPAAFGALIPDPRAAVGYRMMRL